MTSILINTSVTSISGIAGLASNDAITITQSGSVFDPAAGYNTGAPTALNVTVAGYLQVTSFQIGGSYGSFRVTETGSVITSSGILTESNADIFVAGSILSESYGITTLGQSYIEVTGTVRGGYSAVVMNGSGGSSDVLVNHGLVSGRDSSGVYSMGGTISIRNNGTIQGLSTVDGSNPAAILLSGSAEIVNTGTISSGYVGIRLGADTSYFTLNNTGLIEAESYGIRGDIGTTAISHTINNAGSIIAPWAFSGFGEVTYLTNSGLIQGNIGMGGGGDQLDTSHGTILGQIFLGDGADTFRAFGAKVTGDVMGGLGKDSYYIDSDISIVEDATPGEVDTVYARCSHDLADNVEVLRLLGTGAFDGRGNALANEITGNSGANRLLGQAGNDTINGGLGDDLIQGGAATDNLSGNDGDDTVQGGIGTDTLRGDDGDDVLIGGAGKDYMVGGAQSDRFVFQVLNHSAIAQADADTIADFTQGEDLIDLSAIDANCPNALANDAFSFIGTMAFSNVAGQLRYLQSGGNTFLQLDVNGDSLADATIRLNGLITLNAGDLVL